MSRSLYVSVWRNKGALQNTKYANLLEDDKKISDFVAFVKANGFSTVIVYDTWQINGSPNSKYLFDRLNELMTKLRLAGVQQIYVAFGGLRGIDVIKQYNAKYLKGFDGAITEYEFWNGGEFTYQGFIALLKALQEYKQQLAKQNKAFKVGTYIGRLKYAMMTEQDIMKDMSQYLDFLNIDAYVEDPAKMFSRVESRLSLVPSSLDVNIIISAEGTKFSAGREVFLGDYISNASLSILESNFKAQMRAAGKYFTNLKGFNYYSYAYLDYHLKPASATNGLLVFAGIFAVMYYAFNKL